MVDAVVVGQVGRDLVLAVPELPAAGGSVDVSERHELLGGAVNQAVGCVQLGLVTAVVGVVGDDDAGRDVVAQARADRLDVSGVRERQGAPTALFVDVVEPGGSRRLLEHVPDEVRLTVDDVRAADGVLRSARAVLVQAAQPGAAVLEALRLGRAAGALTVLDGAPEDPRDLPALLAPADVVRADAAEAPDVLGTSPDGVAATRTAARDLVRQGLRAVLLAVADEGNVLAYRDGDEVRDVVLPLLGGPPVDPTGGGDAFVAAFVAALLRGDDAETAGWWGSAAAALTVGRLGGRPDLDERRVADLVRRSRDVSGRRP